MTVVDEREAPREFSEAGSPRSNSIRIGALIVGFVLIGIIALFAFGRAEDTVEVSPAVGQLVPRIEGVSLAGEPFDIDDLRGQWVVVNLFATWCVPCQVEHPELVAFSEEHSALGDPSLVSVVFADDDEAVRAFFEERGGDWPVLGQQYSPVVIEFGATAVPETFLVAPNGLVVERLLGGVTSAELNRIIASYSPSE